MQLKELPFSFHCLQKTDRNLQPKSFNVFVFELDFKYA